MLPDGAIIGLLGLYASWLRGVFDSNWSGLLSSFFWPGMSTRLSGSGGKLCLFLRPDPSGAWCSMLCESQLWLAFRTISLYYSSRGTGMFVSRL